MTTYYLKPRGVIGAGLMILLAIAAVAAVAGAYVVSTRYMPPISTVPSSGSGSTTPPTSTTPGASPRVITRSDSTTTIYLHPGDRFVLKLGDDLNWGSVRILDPNIVRYVADQAGTQGLFEAQAKGATTITVDGSPICNAGQACPQFVLLYHLNVVVD